MKRNLNSKLFFITVGLLVAAILLLFIATNQGGTVGGRQGDTYHQRTGVSITE